MNILITIPFIDKNSGGIYQYTIALLRILSKIDFNFFVYNKNKSVDVKSFIDSYENFFLIEDYKSNKLQTFYEKKIIFINRAFSYLFKKKIFNPPTSELDKLIKNYNIDIIHSPYQELFYSSKIPSLITMHDVQELYFPEFFSSYERMQRAITIKML